VPAPPPTRWQDPTIALKWSGQFLRIRLALESRPVGAVAATQRASDSASAFWKIANVVMK
jgi:hypothetical protein